ncbi:MAG: aminotransferase class V-fold PLP-dependent enzyme, partial [Pseudomonadota bacterium]
MIYLDNAATSFPKPEVVYEAMKGFMSDIGANPGRSAHKLSLDSARVVFETREALAELFHVSDSKQIVFTCNATESLNLGILGLLNEGEHVVTTSIEHNSVMRPLRYLEQKKGVRITIVDCSAKGELDLDILRSAIGKDTKLVAVNHASNVMGTILPIEEIGKIAEGIPFLVDAAQTAGVYPIDVEGSNIDLLAFTGHKGLLGPTGVGGLYIKEGLELQPLKYGGTGSNSEREEQPDFLPDKYECGTLNTVGIAGLGAGVRYVIEEGIDEIRLQEIELTKRLLSGLEAIRGVTIYGTKDAKKQTATVSINVDGLEPSHVGYILDREFDIMVRVGLHCAPSAHKTIGTLP